MAVGYRGAAHARRAPLTAPSTVAHAKSFTSFSYPQAKFNFF